MLSSILCLRTKKLCRWLVKAKGKSMYGILIGKVGWVPFVIWRTDEAECHNYVTKSNK